MENQPASYSVASDLIESLPLGGERFLERLALLKRTAEEHRHLISEREYKSLMRQLERNEANIRKYKRCTSFMD
jgi:hypothetical protein